LTLQRYCGSFPESITKQLLLVVIKLYIVVI
jgi:hypothetical protein